MVGTCGTDPAPGENPRGGHECRRQSFRLPRLPVQKSKRGKAIRLVRPKTLCRLCDTIKPVTRRTNGKSMGCAVGQINRTFKSWYGFFIHVEASELEGIDGSMRMRPRSIPRKRCGRKGRGRGSDHQRLPNRCFTNLGLSCQLDARAVENASVRKRANTVW